VPRRQRPTKPLSRYVRLPNGCWICAHRVTVRHNEQRGERHTARGRGDPAVRRAHPHPVGQRRRQPRAGEAGWVWPAGCRARAADGGSTQVRRGLRL